MHAEIEQVLLGERRWALVCADALEVLRGLACLRLGRRLIGVEISEEYCAIARRRLERAEHEVVSEARFFAGAAAQGELFTETP